MVCWLVVVLCVWWLLVVMGTSNGNGGLFPFRLYLLLHLDLGIWYFLNAAPLLVALLSVSVSHSERRLPFLFPSFSRPDYRKLGSGDLPGLYRMAVRILVLVARGAIKAV